MASLADLLTTKIPPHDLEAERGLIGAVLCGLDAMPPLLPEEFYLQRHRHIWTACQACEALDGRPTLVTVVAELRRRGKLEESGGPAHLALCVEEGCTLYPLTGAARTVRDRARERAMIALGADLMREGVSTTEVEARLAALPGPVATAIWDPGESWQRIRSRWGQARLETGWRGLDERTGGLWPGELVVVAGRTSHGKTSFSTAGALRMAASGIPVDILTLEDPVDSMTRRLLSCLTGIPYRDLRSGQIPPIDETKAGYAAEELARMPLTVTGVDRHAKSTEEGVLGLLAACKGRVVILDHLQRVQTKDISRAYALERVLGRIHEHVQRTGQVAWVNCQLNREVEARKDGAPTLADIRDSGSIEILARQVWLLSWPWKWDKKRAYRDYEVNVAKNSDGPTGLVPFSWISKSGRFYDPDEPADHEPDWINEGAA